MNCWLSLNDERQLFIYYYWAQRIHNFSQIILNAVPAFIRARHFLLTRLHELRNLNSVMRQYMKCVHDVNWMSSNLIGNNSKLQFDILHFFLHFFHTAEKWGWSGICIFQVKPCTCPSSSWGARHRLFHWTCSLIPPWCCCIELELKKGHPSRKKEAQSLHGLGKDSPVKFIGDSLHIVHSRRFGFFSVREAPLYILKRGSQISVLCN